MGERAMVDSHHWERLLERAKAGVRAAGDDLRDAWEDCLTEKIQAEKLKIGAGDIAAIVRFALNETFSDLGGFARWEDAWSCTVDAALRQCKKKSRDKTHAIHDHWDRLFAQAKAGSASAWKELKTDWAKRLAQTALRKGWKLQEWEILDIVEEVLESIYLKLSRFEVWQAAWAYARRSCVRRAERRNKKTLPSSSPSSSGAALPDPRSAEQFLEIDERDLLETVLEKYREHPLKLAALTALFIEKQNRKTVAGRFGIAKSTLQHWSAEVMAELVKLLNGGS